MWSPEEVTARAFLAKMKQIDEYIVETVVSKLDSFAALATNQFVPNYMAQGGGDTTIPAAYWTPNLMGYMVEAAIKNKMRDAYMLSGSNLFQQAWMVAQQQPNAQGGQADLNKMNTFKKYFDLFNIDSVLGTQKTFLIRPSALAFVSKNYNTNAAPIFIGGSTGNDIYYQTSKNLPFVNYDVTHTVKCEEVNGQTEYFDIYKLKVKFDLLDNPVGCSGEMRGLLSFKCGEIS
jgi:hypothetical protein